MSKMESLFDWPRMGHSCIHLSLVEPMNPIISVELPSIPTKISTFMAGRGIIICLLLLILLRFQAWVQIFTLVSSRLMVNQSDLLVIWGPQHPAKRGSVNWFQIATA